MPLRLKHLELHGYKSFANKTDFYFGAGVSAIVGPNGSGKCVIGNTLVTLADGRDAPIRELVNVALDTAHTIERLEDGTLTRENPQHLEVLSLNPESLRLERRPVAGFVKRRAPAQLLRVRTRSGREVTATPYHPLFTLEGGQLQALKAEEVKVGQRLAVPRCLPVTGQPMRLSPFDVLECFRAEDRVFVPNSAGLRAWAAETRRKFGTWAGWRRTAQVPDRQFDGLLAGQAVNASHLVRLARAAEVLPPLDGQLKSGNTALHIRLPDAFTPDLARFLGWLVAEGRSTASCQVWFVNADPAVNTEFERLARTLFGVTVHRKRYNARAEDVLIYTASPKLAQQIVALLLRLGIFAVLRPKQKAASNTTRKRVRTYYSVLIYGAQQLRYVAEQLTFVGGKADALQALRDWPTASNPNLDLIPGVTPIVREAARRASLKIKHHRRACPKLAAYAENRCEASRSGLQEVIAQIEQFGDTPGEAHAQLAHLAKLAASDVYWDEIVSVEHVPPSDEWVYDLCVAETHNFVADNIIIHNSNIVDGIRWVLGEQSYSLLRGKKTEDMIFAGSDLRPRAGMAQVTLTFDNSDGWLPIDFTEVAIGRRAFRDGENEYLLNGQRVRLRDLSELLAKCGLSERTYTIIGQGLIDTALSLKAEERRALFEEAAGIGLYRHKREDALKKLENTQRNLDRVLDILAEIKPRLRSLERQAQRARDYHQVKDDLHAILKLWYGYHWHRAVEELEQARVAADHTASELAALQAQQESYDKEVGDLRGRIAALRAQVNVWRGEAEQLRGESESLARELAVADERLRSLAAQREALAAELPPLEAQVSEQAERAAAAQAEVARLTAEAHNAQQQAANAQAALSQREAYRSELRQREAEARHTLAQLESEISAVSARQAQLLERQARLTAANAEQQAVVAQLEAAEAQARARVKEAGLYLDSQHLSRAGAETLINAQGEAIRAAEAEWLSAVERVAAARAEAERLRARQEVLDQARAELVGFTSGAKTLLAQQFPARGVLAEMITVPAELETAITAALGAYLEALVVDHPDQALAALDTLGDANGRATLLPLERPAGEESQGALLAVLHDPDCLGIAARLLSVAEPLRPVIEALLGQAVIVRHRDAALRLLNQLPPSASVVTLAGEVFHAAGPIAGGKEAAPSMLQQARERRDLSTEIEAAQAEIARREAEQEDAARAVEAARQKLTQLQASLRAAQDNERRATIARDSAALEAERAAHEVQLRREQLKALQNEAAEIASALSADQARLAELDQAQHKAANRAQAAALALGEYTLEDVGALLARWQTAAAVAARAVQDAQTRAAELERARAHAEALVNDRRHKIEKLAEEAERVSLSVAEARQRQAALAEQLTAAHTQTLAPAAAQLAELEAQQARLEAGDTEARTVLHAAERQNAATQLAFARKKEELENLRRRVEEDFGLVEFDYGDSVTGPTPLPMYPIVEKLERMSAQNLPEGLEDQLNRKRGQLRRMGAINPDADREYLEVQERHAFLATQVTDLEQAKTQLHDVITEMDLLMEREFRKTFDAVATEFKEIFARLFGGGSAKLLLTDPEHLATSGVDIQCRLPGKRTQTLSMLSGGERSLTACALVFALLKVSPTPFVVLDEVDAMLDEANVGRYRDMLEELSKTTQFIVVTHNRNTVQVAETVYGISMGADTTSQMIGLKLDGEIVKTEKASV